MKKLFIYFLFYFQNSDGMSKIIIIHSKINNFTLTDLNQQRIAVFNAIGISQYYIIMFKSFTKIFTASRMGLFGAFMLANQSPAWLSK